MIFALIMLGYQIIVKNHSFVLYDYNQTEYLCGHCLAKKTYYALGLGRIADNAKLVENLGY